MIGIKKIDFLVWLPLTMIMTDSLGTRLSTITEIMRNKMRFNTRASCFGCRNNKASWSDHDICLMMDSEERFEIMFYTSWYQLFLDTKILDWVKADIKKRLQEDSLSDSV